MSEEDEQLVFSNIVSFVQNIVVLQPRQSKKPRLVPAMTVYSTKPEPNKMAINIYISRFKEYLPRLPIENYIMAVIYMERVTRLPHYPVTLDGSTAHLLWAGCLLVAAKYYLEPEEIFKQPYFANVAGISLQNINNLEIATLKLLKFALWISPFEYQLMLNRFSVKKRRSSSRTP